MRKRQIGNLDDVDIGVLAFLSDTPNSTTSDIVKALNFRKPYNLSRLDAFIRYRLKRFAENGIVKQVKVSRKFRYSVDENKVLFGEGVLKLDELGEVDIGYFIVVKGEDETIAKSIDDYERRIGAKKIFSEK